MPSRAVLPECRTLLASGVLLLVVLGSNEVAAQAPDPVVEEVPAAEEATPPPAPDPSETEARRLFAEAEGLRKAGSCERAAVLYLESRALFESVANTLNGAVCLAKIGREDEALELYQALVGRMRDQLSGEELAAIGPEMQRLRAMLGTIDVAGDVGAQLVIDGRARGTLPLAGPIPIRPGAHDVRVVKDGFRPWATTVDAKVGQVTAVRATLEPLAASGRLVIASPASGELVVDGAPVGPLPFDGALAPGPHVIQVVAGDSGSGLMAVTIVEGQRTEVTPALAPLGGRIEVVTEPLTARLLVDGIAVGTGRWRGRLPVGGQSVEAEEEGYRRVVRELDVGIDDEAQRITLTLERVEDHPRWATLEQGASGAFWIEALGGLAVAPSLGSGAEGSCESATCEGAAPLGFTAAIRVGYELPIRLSFEVAGGALSIGRDLTRTTETSYVDATGGDVPVSYAIEDALRARGGFVAGGIGYRLPVAGPFELRAHALFGLMFLDAEDGASGTGSAYGATAPLRVTRAEDPSLGINFLVAPELDFDLRFDGLVVGLGVAANVVLLGGPNTGLGDVFVEGGCDPAAPSAGCAPGQAFVRDEPAYGTFVAIVPSAHVGYRF